MIGTTEDTIRNERIELMNCGPQLLHSCIDDTLEIEFGLKHAKGWNVFGAAPFELTMELLKADRVNQRWYTYLILEKASRMVIGFGGYAGPPDASRTVKIAYAIAPSFRGKGFATEAAKILIQKAKDSGEVSTVQALTTAEKTASNKVLEKLGFSFAMEVDSETDGAIWVWEKDIIS